MESFTLSVDDCMKRRLYLGLTPKSNRYSAAAP
jgi:hypothetical protein